jgi:endonuclease YncB( thermonuclease family)
MFRTLVLVASLMATPLQAEIISGPARVIDGDTVDMTGTRVRLLGIDAPESAQSCSRGGQSWACGQEATITLDAIIANQPLTCTAQGTDIYGRTLATCQAGVFDIGREMVRRGMALAASNAPEDYAAATAVAKQLSYGLWAGEFEHPEQWRAANPRSAPQLARTEILAPARRFAAASTVSDRRYTNALGCAIKGNYSRYGDLIYHLPGQRYYSQTRPERMFCTEREAMAAGFRRSRE